MTTQHSEPLTEAGRALHRDLWAFARPVETDEVTLRGRILAIEQQAVALERARIVEEAGRKARTQYLGRLPLHDLLAILEGAS